MTDVVIVLEDHDHIVWVLEIQYTKGSLWRQVYQDFDEADKGYQFARDRADTDWQKLYRVNIGTEWNKVMST
jgi:hypothetical protein